MINRHNNVVSKLTLLRRVQQETQKSSKNREVPISLIKVAGKLNFGQCKVY